VIPVAFLTAMAYFFIAPKLENRLSLDAEQALRAAGPRAYVRRSMEWMRAHCEAIVAMQAAGAVAGEIGERLGACSGAALIVDYGFGAADRPRGPTLQAVRGHEKVDVLASPGDVDLSALVDFDRLARQLAPAETWRTTQGSFLTSLGIGHRAAALADARPEAADEIADALERLTSPAAMGTLFKVLAAASPGMWPENMPISGPGPRAARMANPTCATATKNCRPPAFARALDTDAAPRP